MKILVFSDSHRAVNNIIDVLKITEKQVDYVFHLGDLADDIKPFQEYYKDIEFNYVNGNCDLTGADGYDKIVEINSKRIFMTHGHRQDVRYGYDRLVYTAMEREADICLFGHTHIPVIFKEEDILFLCPGSISMPRGGYRQPSYGVIDIDDKGNVTSQVVAVHRGRRYKPIDVFRFDV